MTRVLILGGGGMVGQKLTRRIAANGLQGTSDIDLTLFDIGFPVASAAGTQIIGNLTDVEMLHSIAAQRYDIIFHLAAVVSGEAETDFDKGWAVNMMSMWHLLEALRAEHTASDGFYMSPGLSLRLRLRSSAGLILIRLTTRFSVRRKPVMAPRKRRAS